MSGTGTSYSSGCRVSEWGDPALPENFPVGMRVLLVDDDITCLAVVKQMLSNCKYEVTTCSQAANALSLLRENRGAYDIIISDVHMPDMDGFRLLELVGLEMDLPVIMMSADTRFDIVMKGIRHGACDFLIKPVRMAELQNIWQHVVRRKWFDSKETEHSGSVDEPDHVRQGHDDADFGSATYDGADGSPKSLKKKRDVKEDEDNELDNEDPSSSKKPRVVWSVELHQQFVNAVNQLGIDKAVPKRILELMNVPGLTRENVASHLQKFRLYLKRLSGVTQHQTMLPNSLCGLSSIAKVGHLGGIDFQTLAATGQIPPQTLAALQDELLGHPSRSLPLTSIDQSVIQQASPQENKPLILDKGISFPQPVLKGQSIPSFPVWSSNTFGTWASSNSAGGMNTSQDGNMLPTLLLQQQVQNVLPDTNHLINVQPSSLVSPLKSSENFQFQSGPHMVKQETPIVSLQQSCNFQVGNILFPMNQNSVVLASQPSTSLQSVDNPVTIDQSSKVVPSQPMPNISLANDPKILNQSSAAAPSHPFTSFQTVRNPVITSQNSVVTSSPSSTFQCENNLVPSSHNPNFDVEFADFSQLSSQLNGGPATARQALDGGFTDILAQNSYSIIKYGSSTMTLPTNGSISRQVHVPNGSTSHANGLVCHEPNTSNILSVNNRGLGRFPVQNQGKNLGFVGKGTSLPSRFAMDDMEFPNNDFTHRSVCIGDDGYLLDKDGFAVKNGSIKSGPCATPSLQ